MATHALFEALGVTYKLVEIDLAKGEQKPSIKRLLKQLIDRLNTGITLSECLKEHTNYFDDLYAQIDVLDYANAATRPNDSWKAPAYGTIDASLRHGFKLGDFDTTVTVRVNNLLDTDYIADALDAADPLVWFGYGRTFSLSAKIKF